MQFATAVRELTATGVNLATDTSFMLAVIAYGLSTSTAQFIFAFGTSSTGYSVSFTSIGTINPQVGSSNSGATAPAFSINVPYFICWGRSGTGTSQGFLLVTRLDNGKTVSSQTFTSSTAVTTPTSVTLGTAIASGGMGVAAAAYMGGGSPSLQTATAWAANPWSFWFPNTPIDWVGIAAATAARYPLRMRMGMGI